MTRMLMNVTCPFDVHGTLQSSNWTSDLFSTYSYIFNVN